MFGFFCKKKKKTKKYPIEYTNEFEMGGRMLILRETPDIRLKNVYDQLDDDQKLYLAQLWDRHYDCPDTLEDKIRMALVTYRATRLDEGKFLCLNVSLVLYSRQLEQNYSKLIESSTLALDLETYSAEVARPVAKSIAVALSRDWQSTDVMKATIKITQC